MTHTKTHAIACLALGAGVAVLGAAAFVRRGRREFEEACRAARAAASAASRASDSPDATDAEPDANPSTPRTAVTIDLAALDDLLDAFRGVHEALALLDHCALCGCSVADLPWHAHPHRHGQRVRENPLPSPRRLNAATTYHEAYHGRL